MYEDFSFEIPIDLQEKYISGKKLDMANNKIKKISDITGYIAVLAEFDISSLEKDHYILNYNHPINEHLNKDDAKVYLSIVCAKNSLTPNGKSTFSVNKSVKITAIGKVVRWDSENRTLVICISHELC